MYNYSLSDFFTKSKKKKSSSNSNSDNNNRDMNQKGKRGKPELLRCNAVRNIDYDATPSSSSSSSSFCLSELTTSALVTRSLDLSDRTSFRVNGVGELDVICRSLGLSGPDEFEIPAEVWAARNTRFNSDLLHISRLDGIIGSVVAPKEGGEDVRNLADSYVDSDRFSDRVLSMGASVGIDKGVGAGLGGLKGDRPPVLTPLPSMIRPIVDHSCSTWDLFRSFGPESDNGSPEGTSVLSESCSFTTSNYDDSSSTTTDLTPNISPTGRFRRRITFWQRGKLLGRGSFGSVYEAIAEDGFLLAIKEVSLTDQGSQAKQSVYQLQQEIDLLSRFEHVNIVQYYGTEKDESNLYIFLELVKGSLVSLYQMYRLIDSQVSRYTIQILHGLKYLHDQNVVHRDIKCANILVGADGVVKLADFGLAKATILNDVKSCKGTAFWMAPEVVNGKKQGYGLPADIWSLGCTVLEMFTGQTPYSPMEPIAALFRIGSGEPPPLPKDLSPDAQNFILQCLQKKPSARPSASQLLDHSFVKRWAHLYASTVR